ncbi:MAG TPA: 4-hydroxy-3-methylbut-2-enyl diphosphate reductase [Patescibacteria group bacterium]|nr:4-hydroxy-3-methylbut-2-enyl diphosphate reductase [Patescibacteria group bacterium]
MKITLSKYAGFCFGVSRAFDMVMGIDLERVKKPVFVFGSLVHNDEVNKKIEQKGIKKIERDDFFNSMRGQIGTIIITAHGVGPDVYNIAKEKGIDIIDTTCPKVIKVQRLARYFHKKEYRLVIVGDRDHKEVRGINEWGGSHGYIISQKKDLIDFEPLPGQKIGVLSQTTQNEDFCREIYAALIEKCKNIDTKKTTCDTTHMRQGEIKEMAKKNDVMIIIGSRESANSRRLWEIAVSINPKSYFIEKSGNIRKNWLKGVQSVGVTAGASTPSWIVKDVVKFLEEY